MNAQMRRLPPAVDGLVKVLNGEVIFGINPRNSAVINRLRQLRQLCGDLEELERVRVAIAQLEPRATDPASTGEIVKAKEAELYEKIEKIAVRRKDSWKTAAGRDTSQLARWAWPNLQLKNPAARELSASGERIMERVNARLKFLRTREAIMLVADARGLRLIRWHPLLGSEDALERRLWYFVLELLESGSLHRLRRCQRNECRRWFYAGTEWQKYCSRNCRQREAAQSEVFKEKRKEYMQKRREQEKELEKLSIKQAKRELAKKGRRR